MNGTKIQRLAAQAFQTFSKYRRTDAFSEQLTNLRDLMNHITKVEVNFNSQLVKNKEVYQAESGGKPPVTYVHLWEDDVFSMGIFVLRNGAKIPLHDHPGMHGLIKVLEGKAKLNYYSDLSVNEIPVEVLPQLHPWQIQMTRVVSKCKEEEVNADDVPCLLTPDEGNVHEVCAVDGPMAFLDILSPPYDNVRKCHYYKTLSPVSTDNRTTQGASNLEGIVCLIETAQPHDFYCDQHTYEGPEIQPVWFENDSTDSSQQHRKIHT